MADIQSAGPVFFPPPEGADADGLVAVGGSLSSERLLAAYRSGIFPWYGEHSPVLWWSPDPRCVLDLRKLHIPRSLARLVRAPKFTFSCNTACSQVIAHCAAAVRKGQEGTWILPEMHRAYMRLHTLGFVHSVEAWQDGRLAGGLYGVQMGRVFFGESMFYAVPDASKAAFAWYALGLKARGFAFIDCQQVTPHMLRFGAEAMVRKDFLAWLKDSL